MKISIDNEANIVYKCIKTISTLNTISTVQIKGGMFVHDAAGL